jgi:hypothetical protein
MRKSKLIVLAALTLLIGYTNTVSATNAVTAKESREAIFQKVIDGQTDMMLEKVSESKMGKKTEKMLKKMDKKFGQGKKLDFNSEPDKWLKYALFAWVGGVVFWFMGVFFLYPLWFISWLLFLGAFCLSAYWLLKKFDAI